MSRIVVSTFLSLDGVMQAPGGPEEDPTGGFGHGGRSVTYWDDLMGQVMGEATSTPFAMLLGRKTYEIMAAHWPHAPARPSPGPPVHVRRGPPDESTHTSAAQSCQRRR